MDRRTFLKSTGFVALGAGLAPLGRAIDLVDLRRDSQGQSVATGYVFHDKSGSGLREQGFKGIAGVYVSNGRDVVKTDSRGKYEIPVEAGQVLFVIKPSGWRLPLNPHRLPQFFYVHHPKGSPELRYKGVTATGELPLSIDFALQPQKEDKKFSMILFGDPQPRNQNEIDYIAHDVIEQVARDVKVNNAKFGLSLGDEMFDNLNLYDSLNGIIGTCGIPWYSTVGNHDLNYDSVDNAGSTETWKRVFGPPHYAFNYGPVHFIVLNNVVWHGRATPGYHGEITEDQLAFVKNDLASVSKDKLVVIAMHIPLVELRNKEALMDLFADRKHTFSLSAHTHIQAHHFLGSEDGWNGEGHHHHLNHATVCGSWWQGALDERGIPNATMADGGPNGYSLVEFDGNKYKVSFRAASRPEWEQMGI
ncbi:MAG TPA: calcineurin-like phosphoesterase family protein, partial [Fimbriimonas sp.]|nr:calcineurin-like phosphoesterase family protein [Fimbriimonas sp.]